MTGALGTYLLSVAAVGLLVSALLKKSESAILPIIVIIILQVVFAGALIEFEMPVKVIYYFTPTMYGTSDIPKFCQSQMNGTPWDNYEELWRASPIKYADKVTTPTLFLQYGDDFRCPMQEAVQMYIALMLRGIETRLVIFHGNSHKMRSLGKPTQRNRRCREIIEWLEKYVKNAK